MFILKAQGICWKDRRGVALGQQSKGIHWVDLFIAWWRHHKPPEMGAYERLSEFFLFYLRFRFETLTVSYSGLNQPILACNTSFPLKIQSWKAAHLPTLEIRVEQGGIVPVRSEHWK